MRRHRSGAPPPEEESSSDEEDAFAVMSRKSKKAKIKEEPFAPTARDTLATTVQHNVAIKQEAPPESTAGDPGIPVLPTSTTSSMKRHHGVSSDTRKAKMDALLQELEVEKQKVGREPSRSREKKGSFVESGQEYTTTNIFVGNLAPTMTEEILTDFFQQFGVLHSIKIMWPRSPEDARNRLTGFVCYMHRPDAEDAMNACDNTDPFNCGRQIAMRWGKNVKTAVRQGNGMENAEPAAKGSFEASSRPRPIRVLPPRDLRRNAAHGGADLTSEEQRDFDRLTKQELCAGREPICRAMAFCFEKSGAAKTIASQLKALLVDSSPSVTVSTRIARLYLISDVLYNSQQPGVRNAFFYRDAVERMAPEVFTSLGKHGGGNVGRMSLNKLSTAVSAVLAAWTNWNVYNPMFLDELHDLFQGREAAKNTRDDKVHESKSDSVTAPVVKLESNAIRSKPQGDWKNLGPDEDEIDLDESDGVDGGAVEETEAIGAGVISNDSQTGGCFLVERTDLRVEQCADGRPRGDTDGIPLDEDDTDGEPLGSDDDIDGEQLDMETDGIALDDVDGASLDADDTDGEPLEDDDVGSLSGVDGMHMGAAESSNAKRLHEEEEDGEVLDDDADGVSI